LAHHTYCSPIFIDDVCADQDPVKRKNFFGFGDLTFYEDGRTVCMVGQSSYRLDKTLDRLSENYLTFQREQNLDADEVNAVLKFIEEKLTEEKGLHLRVDLRYDVESQEGALLVYDNKGNEDYLLGSMTLGRDTVLGLMYGNEKEHCGPVSFISDYYEPNLDMLDSN